MQSSIKLNATIIPITLYFVIDDNAGLTGLGGMHRPICAEHCFIHTKLLLPGFNQTLTLQVIAKACPTGKPDKLLKIQRRHQNRFFFTIGCDTQQPGTSGFGAASDPLSGTGAFDGFAQTP